MSPWGLYGARLRGLPFLDLIGLRRAALWRSVAFCPSRTFLVLGRAATLTASGAPRLRRPIYFGVLAEFREFFYARVKTNPQSNCLVCPREANGPYAIIAQFLATRPDVPVDGRTLRDVIARLLEEGGYAGLVKFIKDHNVCPKCEAATVCTAKVDAGAAHWDVKIKEIRDYHATHLALHIAIHKFL
ncbi:hypothetical protein M885DRAFT_501744 [Pelagophyceae sp. CCMP2097]|nr:hypothetical protein M885DRAFT_501744 [Pelagophyceae sp. CCMP2097]